MQLAWLGCWLALHHHPVINAHSGPEIECLGAWLFCRVMLNRLYAKSELVVGWQPTAAAAIRARELMLM